VVHNEWSWGMEEDAFPSDIDPYEFFTKSSSDTGESTSVSCRMDIHTYRQIDELVSILRQMGYEMRTVSDFVRWACFSGLGKLRQFVDAQDDESYTHWLVLEKSAMRQRENALQLVKIKKAAREMTQIVSFFVKEKEWEQGLLRLNDTLGPIMAMAGKGDFLMRMYIREIFSNKQFITDFETLRKNVRNLTPIVENAYKAYERMKK
jgi:hypothetical protein